MIWPALKMLLALGVIVGVFFVLLRALRRNHGLGKGLSGDPWIRILASKPIGPQKYVTLVEIGGEVLALGVSETQITPLGKIENRAWVERMVAGPPSETQGVPWFSSLPLRQKGPKFRWMRLLHAK